ncbi:hypothetical protein [Limnohabitans sp. 2KL-1]|uniref:hypothetical protein n=1 Tax=Limnohabitans sp. 2KL-1 TaxID=1100699 RepID=UPI0011B21499|nr:hypothetical protein [Limnohabitans sp. 2KL-1]
MQRGRITQSTGQGRSAVYIGSRNLGSQATDERGVSRCRVYASGGQGADAHHQHVGDLGGQGLNLQRQIGRDARHHYGAGGRSNRVQVQQVERGIGRQAQSSLDRRLSLGKGLATIDQRLDQGGDRIDHLSRRRSRQFDRKRQAGGGVHTIPAHHDLACLGNQIGGELVFAKCVGLGGGPRVIQRLAIGTQQHHGGTLDVSINDRALSERNGLCGRGATRRPDEPQQTSTKEPRGIKAQRHGAGMHCCGVKRRISCRRLWDRSWHRHRRSCRLLRQFRVSRCRGLRQLGVATAGLQKLTKGFDRLFNDFAVTRQVCGCISLGLRLVRFARGVGQVFAALRVGFSLSVFLSALLGPRLLSHQGS